MSSVDNRAVHMTFDNKSFEKNLAETMRSMDALKKSLDFSSAKKGFADLNAASRGFNLSHLTSGIEGLSNKFIALGTIAVTTLANITNRAVDTGIQLAKSLTLDPVMQGFQEYETNIRSIQTILANTQADGTNLGQVNDALDQLNRYADQTIYNFSEMTRNIGTFTAAGVDLDTSVSAIQGIANLAAISGSSSQQAATAMYQLSQAISTGTVRLMDWNSVVNAGMGGEVFQRALFETGKAMGTLTDVDISTTFDEWKASGNSFRQSLSEIQNEAGDATDELTRVTTENAKAIADAEESAAESIVNSKKTVEDAQERVADASKRAAEDMADAVENQRQVNERAAESIQRAFENVIEARDRLRRALEPASEDDLGAATDRLRTAQLDQADLANAITEAQKDQKNAADELARAQQELIKAQSSGTSTSQKVIDAKRRVEAAESRVLDLADAVERARISQNNATRDVTRAEQELTEVKNKGTEADLNVIDARTALAAAEESYIETKKDADNDILEAAQRIAEVSTQSAKQQQDALEGLEAAQISAAKIAEDAQERIAKAHEDATRRIEAANQADSPLPGWLTSDVLTTTLQAFAGGLDEAGLKALGYTEAQIPSLIELGKTGQDAATKVKTLTQLLQTVKEAIGSGWSSSFRIIIGDFEEAKSMFTEFSDAIKEVVDSSTSRRNDLLQGWADLGGREKLIEGIKNAFRGLSEILGTVSDAFHKVFPPATAERLFALTEKFADFTAKLNLSQGALDNIGRYFTAFFQIVKIGVEVFKGIGRVITDVFRHFTSGTSDEALGFFDKIANAIDNLYDVLIGRGGLDRFFQAITDRIISFGEALKDPGQFIEDFADSMRDAFDKVMSVFKADSDEEGPWSEKSPIIGALFRFRDLLQTGFDAVGDAFQRIQDILNDIFGTDIDLSIPDGIADFFDRVFGNIDENTTNSVEMSDGLNRIATALSFLWDVVEGIGEVIGFFFDKLQDIGSWVLNVGGKVLDFFEQLGPNLQDAFMSEEFDKFLDVLTAIAQLMGGAGLFGLGTKGLGVNANVDLTGGALPRFNALLQSFVGVGPSVTRTFGALTDTFKAMQTEIKAKALFQIAKAIALITASTIALSFIDPAALAKSLTAMSVGFGQLLGAFAILNVIAAGPKGAVNFAAVSTGLIALSTAILILSGAMAVMATLSWDEIGKGLTGLAGALVILVAATKLISGGGGLSLIATGIGLSAVAASMILLAGAVKVFSLMSWEDIGKGLAAIAGGLLIMAGALQLMPVTTILVGPGLLAVAFALVELGAALLIFATMSWEEIGKGLAVLGGGLLIIAGAMNLMPVSTILSGPGLVAIATGLTILGGALKIFATMSWEEIGRAMTVLASSLLILTVAMNSMSGAVTGAAAVGIAAVSLLLLTKALKEMAKMSWKEVGKGLGIMAAALTALGVAAYALSATGATGAIFTLGLALLALGAGFVVIGIGAGLLAEAFQIIAAAGTAGIDVLMYAIDQLLIRLPEMARQLAVSILDMADIILTAAPKLIDKLGEVVGELLELIANNADNFAVAATAWIVSMLKVIRDSSPDFIKTAMQLIADFLHGVEANAQEYARSGLAIITEFLRGLTQGIPAFVDAAVELIATFLTELADHAGELVTAGLALLLSLLDGITDNLDEIEDSVAALIDRLILEIANLAGDIVDAGIDALIAFLEGLAEDIPEIAENVGKMVTNIIDALADEFVAAVDRTARIIIDFLNDLAAVIRKNDDDLSDAFANLGAAIIEGIIVGLVASYPKLATKIAKLMADAVKEAGKPWEWFSPSHVMMRMGNDIIEGLIIGLDDKSRNLNQKLNRIGNTAVSTFQNALDTASNTLQETSEFNPTITPVLDLTQVQASAAGIQNMLGTKPFTTDVSFRQANQLLAETSQTDNNDQEKEEPVRSITFIQTNNSPEQLSTAIIYKKTRSQIELAKEELGIK